MNIVRMILELLSGSVMSKLSSLIGESEAKTKTIVGAAVPALLSAFSKLASNEQGAEKLVGALGKFDSASLANLGNLLSGGSSEKVEEQGHSLLSSLLGGGTVAGLANVLGRFAGLNGGASKSLLSYLGPLVLGAIAKHFVGKPLNAKSLMNLFSEQKGNIASAIPPGLSLADVPGLETARSTGPTAYASRGDAVGGPAKPSVLPWLLGLAALAAVLGYVWSRTPAEAPAVTETKDNAAAAVTQVKDNVTETFSTLSKTLASVTDVASANAALPALSALGTKVDGMQAMLDKLPAAAKSSVTALIQPGLSKLSEQFNRVLMIPGVGPLLRPVLEGIVGKLTALAGLTPAQFSLPSAQVTEYGSGLSALLASLTESLGTVKDADTANAALPRLQEINDQLDTTAADLEKLPAEGKATVGSFVKSALATLTDLVKKVLGIAGVEDIVKPVTDEILRKLASLGT